MSPARGRTGPGPVSLVPPKTLAGESHKGAQWCVSDCSLSVPAPGSRCFRYRETPLRRSTSIAHHAFMSTTGETGRGPEEAVRDALTAPTGVAP